MLVAASTVASVAAGQPAAPVHDLASLTRHAESSYPRLEADAAAVDAAEARLREARTSPWFQFTGTAAFTVAPGARGTPIYSDDDELPLGNRWHPAGRLRVEGALPLYTFGKLRAARDAAGAGVRAAELGRERTLSKLRHDVRRAYYALQLSLDIRQMIQEGEGKLTRAVEELDERLEDGDPDVDEQDRFRLVAAVAEVNARSSEAQRLEDSSRAALRALTGLGRFRVPECPLAPVEVDLDELAHYLGQVDERPETGMLEALLEARRAGVSAARAGYFPDLGLVLRASRSWHGGQTDQDNPFIQDDNYASLGFALVARWSLDVAGNVHRTRRAEAQLAEARAQAEEARRGMALEIELAYHRVVDARRREEAWAVGERETRRWFISAAQGFQIGAVEPKDLVDAVKAYFLARFNHLQAVAEYNTALATLERDTGAELLPVDRWEVRCE